MIAVLFARADSVYKTLPDCDVWDEARDARKWPGGCPMVAHPPCRAWGAFRHRAKPARGEKELALFAVAQVRRWGGVLEHPVGSMLWTAAQLPFPGKRDGFGGWTMGIHQHSFGHRARKKTFLYIVGVEPTEIPDFPLVLGDAEYVIGDVGRATAGTKRPEASKAERERTPEKLARWLVELASRCVKSGVKNG